jgi:hypothetical protein
VGEGRGGGIVEDSTATRCLKYYGEQMWKQRFIQGIAEEFVLLLC